MKKIFLYPAKNLVLVIPIVLLLGFLTGSLSNTVKGRSELDFLQSQPLISLTVNQAVKRAPWNVYFPPTGPPVA